ncbi:MAG: polysaccharide deacetylase family protein [Bryobacteraceae bacterium]|jgi:peptidoglycan/xylan/chitin deacetylase (PgdA/CDA1 family)
MSGFITTSWDDGHPLDLRLATLLLKYGLKGTFYIPTRRSDWALMTKAEIITLDRMGMEIGSHTVNHAILPQLPLERARLELIESRKMLEDVLGKPVPAFCFPKGEFNAQTCRLARNAGYQVARTTVGFRTEREFNPSRMPVSVHFVPHSRAIHIRHALKEGNARGLFNWYSACNLETDLEHLCVMLMQRASAQGGVFHIWGHSWEIGRLDLWRKLDDVLKRASSIGLEARTNSQLVSR